MKKLIKFVFFLALIAVLVFIGVNILKNFGLFREKVPGIEEYEWKLIQTRSDSTYDSEHPELYGLEGVGYTDQEPVDIKLYLKEGMVHIEKDGEIVAVSDIIDGERDENNNYKNDGTYVAYFDGCECRLSVNITDHVDWNTEYSGFDGNLYGKYFIDLEVDYSDGKYIMQFFSMD